MQSQVDRIVEVIAGNLHKLEELHLCDIKRHETDTLECLVTGCSKLKILHIGFGATIKSLECLLLGLPNLIEFIHPGMADALQKIIQDGKTSHLPSLRNLFVDAEGTGRAGRVRRLQSADFVMSHLNNITKLHIDRASPLVRKTVAQFPPSVSKLRYLTELTAKNFPDIKYDIAPTIKEVGHQLRLLDLYCSSNLDHQSIDEVIDQCRSLRVLRLKFHSIKGYRSKRDNYGHDLTDIFTSFQHLEELQLERLTQCHLNPVLFTSLIASPVLHKLTLIYVSNFTDHVIRAAFNHRNVEGQKDAFTSLRKMTVDDPTSVSDFAKHILSHDKVPLESIEKVQLYHYR